MYSISTNEGHLFRMSLTLIRFHFKNIRIVIEGQASYAHIMVVYLCPLVFMLALIAPLASGH